MPNIISDLRGASGKFAMKVMLFMLSLSFIFWGMAGTIMPAGNNAAVVVAGRQISLHEVDRELRRQVAQMRELMGGVQFDARQALRMGFLNQVVDNIVWRELLDAQTTRMHLVPSDEHVFNMIVHGYAEFHDEEGNFSPEIFSFLLHSNNITERDFVAAVARELARAMLLGALTSDLNTEFFASMLASHAAQERVADVAVLRFDAERVPARATDDDLRALYESNLEQFKEPEFRRISLITVTEAAAREGRPEAEGADLFRLMMEMAESIIDEKSGGLSNAQIVEKFGVGLQSLPPVNMDGNLMGGGRAPAALIPRLRDIAFFALDEGGISDLQDVGDNIVLVVLDEVIPAAPRPMAEVRGELEGFWTRSQQEASANTKAVELLARLRLGEGFAEAVAAVDAGMQFRPNLRLTAVGTEISHEARASIFNAEVGVPLVLRGRDGYYIMALRSIRMPSVEPTEEQRVEANETMRALLISDYVSWLERRLGVRRNEAVLGRIVE